MIDNFNNGQNLFQAVFRLVKQQHSRRQKGQFFQPKQMSKSYLKYFQQYLPWENNYILY